MDLTNSGIYVIEQLLGRVLTAMQHSFWSKQREYIRHWRSHTNHLKCRFYARDFIRILVITAIIGSPVVCLASGEDNPKPETASEQIKLMNLFRVMSPHGQLNVVQVQYEFPAKRHVVASSHGLVSGKGTLRFLTKADRLEFRDPTSNALLAAVKIDKNIKLMGRKETPIPLESDFPATSRTAKWNKRHPFGDNLISVLNRHFPNGYLTTRKEERRVFITNYKVFNDLAGYEKARVAAMIKVPSSTDLEKPTLFRVHFLAQERRSRTEWRRAESEAVVAHVQKFVRRLTRELAGGGQ